MTRSLILSLLLLSTWCASAQTEVTPFAAATDSRPPSPWQLVTNRGARPTQFDVVEQNGARVLMAYSANATASLRHPLRLDPAGHARLRWRWRVDELPASSDLADRSRDDYAARLCVSFEPDASVVGLGGRAVRALGNLFGGDTPLAAICYTWDENYPVGHRAEHSDNERIGLVVLRSGRDGMGEWQDESRDIVADYRAHFDADPQRITAVLVAASTAATGERSLAWFADIAFDSEE